MSRCPSCDYEDAYVGFNDVECLNGRCRHYSEKHFAEWMGAMTKKVSTTPLQREDTQPTEDTYYYLDGAWHTADQVDLSSFPGQVCIDGDWFDNTAFPFPYSQRASTAPTTDPWGDPLVACASPASTGPASYPTASHSWCAQSDDSPSDYTKVIYTTMAKWLAYESQPKPSLSTAPAIHWIAGQPQPQWCSGYTTGHPTGALQRDLSALQDLANDCATMAAELYPDRPFESTAQMLMHLRAELHEILDRLEQFSQSLRK